jgi:transcriptional regulator with XRE-family HTH domain
MPGVAFREFLQCELDRRRGANPRYSLRAFASALGVDHSTLSQILRGTRRVTVRTLRALGARLRLSEAEIERRCAAETEAAVLDAVRHARFRPDSRWTAMTLGVPIDEVNVALQALLRRRLLVMRGDQWRIQ